MNPKERIVTCSDAFATVSKCTPDDDDEAHIATPRDYPGLLGVVETWQRHVIAKLPRVARAQHKYTFLEPQLNWVIT